jgi:cytochrome bd ubiquinol oxidase subunit II
MLDYTFLKIIWWVLLGLVLITYATTAGYDAGITMIMPFLKSETDRRVVLNTSAPVWDGNLSWIVFAGGGLFVIWPVVYSTAFSGLYAAMLCILWAFFFRATGFDYRGKINKHLWRRFWDLGLLVSGGLPVFIFGVAMGNCLLGFPFHFDPITFRDYYTGNFWGLLSGFAILTGIVSVLMVLMHGAAYIQQHTEDHLRELAHKLFYLFNILVLITLTVAGLLVIFSLNGYTLVSSPPHATLYPVNNVVTRGVGAWIDSYVVYVWKFYPPIITYLALLAGLWANYLRWVSFCFWASVISVGGIIATAGVTLFPFLMPSSTNPSQSLTVWNSTSSQYALDVMLYIGVVLFIIIIGYKIFAFRAVWGKKKTITAKDIEEHDHGFY